MLQNKASLIRQVLLGVLTVFLYSTLLGWKFALLIVVGILWHECSHLLAAYMVGLSDFSIYLIPFVGGVATFKGKYKNYSHQAFVAMAGPVGGGISAAIAYGIYHWTHDIFWARAANILLLLNFFNMMPFSFLDGGQILRSVAYSIGITTGTVVMTISTLVGAIVLFHMAPVIGVLVIVFGGSSVYYEIKNYLLYKRGSAWMCSEEWLIRPEKMSWNNLSFVVGVYFIVIGLFITAFPVVHAALGRLPLFP